MTPARLSGKSRQRCRISPDSLLDQDIRFGDPARCPGSRASAVGSPRAHFQTKPFVFDTRQAVWEIAPALSHLPRLTSGPRHLFLVPGRLSRKCASAVASSQGDQGPPGFNSSLQAAIEASRLQFNSSLEASIQASRLQFKPPGFNSSLLASIQGSRLQFKPPGFNSRVLASIQASKLQFKPPGFT